ncbi:MAG: SMI1/KNR4 family protein [Clostridiales bacterium]
MKNWNTLYKGLTSKLDYIKPNPPAAQQQILDAEKLLGNELPADLKELLLAMNGDGCFIFSVEQIVDTNLSARKFDWCMPLDCLLFFADNGCGDYYGYPITPQDGVRDDNVFMWEHEYDNRIWKANNLEDTIKKFYNDEI